MGGAAPSLTIGRLALAWQAPDDSRAHHAIAGFESAIRRDLSVELARAFPSDMADPGAILCLPRLDLDLDVDLGASPEAVLRSWIRGFVEAFARQSRAAQTVRFASAAERMAAFLTDLATGSAWPKWYWRDFTSLRPLARSAAIRTALLRDEEHAIAALRALYPARVQLVLMALDRADARAVAGPLLRALIPVAGAVDADHLAAGRAVAADAPDPVNALAGERLLLARIARGDPFAVSSPAEVDALVATYAADAAVPRDVRLRPSFRGPVGLPDERSEARRGPCGPQAAARDAGGGAGTTRVPASALHTSDITSAFTAWGGAFLLWPQLAAIPVECLVAGDPARADALRLAALAEALGERDGMRALDDPSLLAMLADPALAETWPLACLPAPEDMLPARTLAALAEWYREEGVTGARWLQLRRQPALHVLRGDRQGYWLAAGPQTGPHGFAAAMPPGNTTDSEDAGLLLGTATLSLSGQLAQIALRRFAWRIPGFSRASIAFLRENFLGQYAEIRREGARAVVNLGPSPIGILLGMTGLSRQSYATAAGVSVLLQQAEGQ